MAAVVERDVALQAVFEEGLFAAAVSALSHFCFDEFGAIVIDLTFICFYACYCVNLTNCLSSSLSFSSFECVSTLMQPAN